MDIFVASSVTEENLFDSLTEMSYDELSDFIMRLDGEVADWEFTKLLHDKLSDLMKRYPKDED